MVRLPRAYPLHQLTMSSSLCLPVDTARAFSTEEMKLLSVDTSGGAPLQHQLSLTEWIFANLSIFPVPKIVIVTKGDGLVTKHFDQLRSRADPVPVREARKQAVSLAEEEFKNKIVPRIMSTEHPPAQCVFVRSKGSHQWSFDLVLNIYPMIDMHKTESNCTEIVEKMAEAITNDALQVLFVSTQKNNVELCTKYAIKE